MTGIDSSVVDLFAQHRQEAAALANAISKHLDAHPELPRRFKDQMNLIWSAVDVAVNEMGCAVCEHERIGIVDCGLDGLRCEACAERGL
jgi:hypothetical protein